MLASPVRDERDEGKEGTKTYDKAGKVDSFRWRAQQEPLEMTQAEHTEVNQGAWKLGD